LKKGHKLLSLERKRERGEGRLVSRSVSSVYRERRKNRDMPVRAICREGKTEKERKKKGSRTLATAEKKGEVRVQIWLASPIQ